jgi:hypothetical protein
MARHDALTRLPNRVLFRERMEQAIAMAGRGTEFAVICFDLDNFKQVNDTLGHPVGDGLLVAVSERLRTCVREVDTLARYCATIWMRNVLPHPGMFPSGSGIASSGCSRRRVALSIGLRPKPAFLFDR